MTIIISDELLLAVLCLTLIASIRYGIRHKDYVVGMGWVLPLVGLLLYYLALVIKIPHFVDDISLRQAIVRPSLVGFFVMAAVHVLNGTVNYVITFTYQRIQSWTRNLHKLFSRHPS